MKFTNFSGVEIQIAEEAIEKLRRQFRESLAPFGLDKFVLDGGVRIVEMPGGKLLAEMRTMRLPVWYPDELEKLRNAGFKVVTKIKWSKIHAPCEMYWVQGAWEIGGKQIGN